MTDKELRKLSRLELLELLLRESKENRELKAELEKIKGEKSFEKTTEQLKEAAAQFDTSMQSAESLVTMLQRLVFGEAAASADSGARDKDSRDALTRKKMLTDIDIYRRLMVFYSQNTDALSALPDRLREDIIRRLREAMGE